MSINVGETDIPNNTLLEAKLKHVSIKVDDT